MNKILKYTSLFAFVAIIGILINSCGNDNVTNNTNVPAGTIRGTITFVDTNRVYNNGYYDVSVYSSWPPAGPPSGSDTITLVKNGNTYTGTYEITGLSAGSYVTTSAFIRTPYGRFCLFIGHERV
ncbi:MAG: hypothetical protein IT280_10645 [Ignavibacteria bacterium]|nr:hypothetical protein [Ignavibacteria bacterium]